MGELEGYTIKDRIAILADTIASQFTSIITQLDKIEAKLDGKASNERVAALEVKLADLELRHSERLTTLEAGNTVKTEFTTRDRIYLGFGVTIFASVISALIYIAASGVH